MTEIGLDGLVALLAGGGSARRLVALAGPPGSGKSTVAEALVARLCAGDPERAALLPMDGYHYDDRLLDRLGRRQRKGAPDTFDVGGLAHMLLRLRAADEDAVAVPVFDRDIEIARAGARLIPRAATTIVVEGNYLLLAEPPWDRLKPLFDVTVMVAVPETELRRRLEARWRGYGLAPAAIAAKVDGNDLPNGRMVIARSAAADYTLAN